MNSNLLESFGISEPACGAQWPPGWEPLIKDLIKELIALGWDKDLQQIKSKFGSMRFYIGKGNPSLYNAISKAEERTAEICLECGKHVTDITNHFAIRCSGCEAERAKKP